MKALLVVDIDDDVNIEDIGITYIIQHWSGLLVKAQVESVPLKPLPKKRKEINDLTVEAYVNDAWNACINEILGEEE